MPVLRVGTVARRLWGATEMFGSGGIIVVPLGGEGGEREPAGRATRPAVVGMVPGKGDEA